MTLSQIYSMLDMDSPSDFEYFEQLADLIECEEEIPYDLFFMTLSEVSSETTTDILGNYIEEISDALPDETQDLFSLVDSIQQQLLSLCENLEDDNCRRSFAEELFRFRTWYTRPGSVLADGQPCSMLEAVTLRREEAFTGEEHDYDFSGCMDYELPELSIGLGRFSRIDIVGSDGEEDEEKNGIE